MNRKVTVVGGAGNVGATVARAIADKELADVVGHGLVLAWWLIWVLVEVRGNLGPSTDPFADVPDVSDVAVVAIVATVGVLLTAVCAVLAVRVVRMVTRLQMSRPWTPWWATDPSTAAQLWPAQHLQQIQGAGVTTPHGQGPQQPYGQQPYGEPEPAPHRSPSDDANPVPACPPAGGVAAPIRPAAGITTGGAPAAGSARRTSRGRRSAPPR